MRDAELRRLREQLANVSEALKGETEKGAMLEAEIADLRAGLRKTHESRYARSPRSPDDDSGGRRR
jgi:hypothetical protein